MPLTMFLLLSLLFCGAFGGFPNTLGKATDRIVGGKEAPDGAFPFQISLQQSNSHFCSGVIIADRWILTAAHCVTGKSPGGVSILVGTNSVSKGGTRYKIDKFIVHEDYTHRPNKNDIALMRTTEKIKYTDKVKAIEIASEDPEPGTKCVASGWGYTTQNQRNLSDKLKMLDEKILSEKECKTDYLVRFEKTHPITPNHICTYAGSAGQGLCNGDSGGSLICDNKSVGIASWVIPCARGQPDVYTRTSKYLSWVNEKMKANEPK